MFTKHPIIIAGPCSAESYNQVISTAKALSDIKDISLFRAGIWKPRTRPGGFDGVGEDGLKWLQDVKQQFNLRVCTEIANPHHAELILKYNIDAVWIGARTTTNPFSVNEIASSLKGVDIPVMVKNPMHPDIKLWLGAIERFKNLGISNIAAIHRGFYYYGNEKYRNKPLWQIPLELKTILPDISIICDPSHISGNKTLVETIAQKAMNIGMNGLMIETHINPELALSDKEQQLSPLELKDLLTHLHYPAISTSNNQFNNQLADLRAIIDEIDEDLLNLLSKRTDIVKQIAYYKKEHSITAFQLSRWKEIIKTRKHISDKLDLDDEFILNILSLIHEYSINTQNQIINHSAGIKKEN